MDCLWGESLHRGQVPPKYFKASKLKYSTPLSIEWYHTEGQLWKIPLASGLAHLGLTFLCPCAPLGWFSFLEWAEISLDTILPTIQSAEIRWENMCKDVVAHRAEITRRDPRGFFLVPVRTSHSWLSYLYQPLPSCDLSALLLLSDWKLSYLPPGALVLMFLTLTFVFIRLLRI